MKIRQLWLRARRKPCSWRIIVKPTAATGILFVLLAGTQAFAGGATEQNGLTIDIPANIKEAKVVLNISRPAFEGDEPAGLSYVRVMSSRFQQDGVKADIIAVFHGESGYMLLDDDTYDRVRKWQDGNPYKKQIAEFQKLGVQFEECGKTMVDNHWVNADMLPGVKINAGANFRVIELVQQGYTQLQP
ncbi:DsrE family protein [Mesorhizobium intechi]|uniref:DsrE family protein n=1 Tax=Mesorhizobium intechi TaxID=537601 RepID=UPI000CC8C343|nr:DsrE family protein [Mesorhizobium intechi]TSE07057.1 DsrE family protein [Mesorhizobium intechi]